MGLLSSENFTGFLVNLSSYLGARHGFCYSRTLVGSPGVVRAATGPHLWECGGSPASLIQSSWAYSGTFSSSPLFLLSIEYVKKKKKRPEVLGRLNLAWVFVGVHF